MSNEVLDLLQSTNRLDSKKERKRDKKQKQKDEKREAKANGAVQEIQRMQKKADGTDR